MMKKILEILRRGNDKLSVARTIGFIPALYVGRRTDSSLACFGFFFLWMLLVDVVYLIYRYFKD